MGINLKTTAQQHRTVYIVSAYWAAYDFQLVMVGSSITLPASIKLRAEQERVVTRGGSHFTIHHKTISI